ncbi:MAG: threonine synthase [Myxococcaceae bacterium]|nr:threonine synthase [Myxococcaceae bacterium]
MKYLSTRGKAPAVDFSGGVLTGLAPDGGLYVPEEVPVLLPDAFEQADTLPAVAKVLLAPFLEGDALAGELPAMVDEAFTFEAPLTATTDARLRVLELFHGPTAAFKDFGARFLAACLRRLLTARGEVTVVVATSGDTGSAVAAAFHRVPKVKVVVLYPDGQVSPRQAHQLGCFGDNVRAFKVGANFDTCQAMVKRAFADEALRAKVALASANSISLGRLLPQLAYYAHAALMHWRATGEVLNVSVPTGNLGNGFACLLARAVGLPLGEVVLATNANRTIVEHFAGRQEVRRASTPTLANAMDVAHPSNLERLDWLAPRRVTASAVDDEDIRRTIREGEARFGRAWCPHTACGVEAVLRRRSNGDTKTWAVAATAHAAKFEQVVEPLLGHAVEVPAPLQAMLARPSKAEALAPDDAALHQVLLG